MLRTYLLPLLLLMTLTAHAQDALHSLYTRPYSLQAAALMPSRLYNPAHRWQVGLPSPGLWVRNSISSYPLAANFLAGNPLNEADKQDFLDQVGNALKVNLGANMLVLGGAYQLPDSLSTAFSLTVTERVAGTFHIGHNFLHFMLEGNKFTINNPTDLAQDMLVTAFWMREYAAGWATDVPLDLGDTRLRFGLRAKLLTAQAGVQLRDAKAVVMTDPDGEYISADYRYSLYMTKETKPFGSAGMGWGIDASLEATLASRTRIGLAMLDLGSLKYNKNVEEYRGDAKTVYDQLIVGSLFWDDRFADESATNKQKYPLAPDTITNASFTQKLPTRLLLNVQHGLGTLMDDGPGGMPYYKHNLFLTGVLPFQDSPGTSAIPRVSLAYQYALFANRLNVGASALAGGYNKWGLGAFMSWNTGGFSLGLGSENLTTLLMGDDLSGGDVALNMTAFF